MKNRKLLSLSLAIGAGFFVLGLAAWFLRSSREPSVASPKPASQTRVTSTPAAAEVRPSAQEQSAVETSGDTGDVPPASILAPKEEQEKKKQPGAFVIGGQCENCKDIEISNLPSEQGAFHFVCHEFKDDPEVVRKICPLLKEFHEKFKEEFGTPPYRSLSVRCKHLAEYLAPKFEDFRKTFLLDASIQLGEGNLKRLDALSQREYFFAPWYYHTIQSAMRRSEGAHDPCNAIDWFEKEKRARIERARTLKNNKDCARSQF